MALAQASTAARAPGRESPIPMCAQNRAALAAAPAASATLPLTSPAAPETSRPRASMARRQGASSSAATREVLPGSPVPASQEVVATTAPIESSPIARPAVRRRRQRESGGLIPSQALPVMHGVSDRPSSVRLTFLP